MKGPIAKMVDNYPLPAIWSTDWYMLGFVENVNRAMAEVDTEWALIWNDDAYPCFTAEELSEALQALPEEVKCAAPVKRIKPGQVLQRHHWSEAKTYKTVEGGEVDATQEFLHTHCHITEVGPWWVAQAKKDWKEPYYQVGGTSYCPLFAVRTEWFHSIGGFDMMYSPGYYEDAHFWRLTRRLGGETVVLPQLEYDHEGRGTFARIYDPDSLREHQQENLRRYLLVWGHTL